MLIRFISKALEQVLIIYNSFYLSDIRRNQKKEINSNNLEKQILPKEIDKKLLINEKP